MFSLIESIQLQLTIRSSCYMNILAWIIIIPEIHGQHLVAADVTYYYQNT